MKKCFGFSRFLMAPFRPFLLDRWKKATGANEGLEFIDLECRSSIRRAMVTLLGMRLSGERPCLLWATFNDPRVGNCPMLRLLWLAGAGDMQGWRHFKNPLDLMSYDRERFSGRAFELVPVTARWHRRSRRAQNGSAGTAKPMAADTPRNLFL